MRRGAPAEPVCILQRQIPKPPPAPHFWCRPGQLATMRDLIMIVESANPIKFVLPADINVEFIGDFDPETRIAHIGFIVSSERGAGHKAVNAFEKWARDQGAVKITGKAVRESLPFWWKMGFRDRDRNEHLVPIWKTL